MTSPGMPKYLLKLKKGFTLLEILISVAILTFVALAIYGVIVAGQRTYYSGLGTLELQSQARLAFFTMTRELREATSFAVTPVGADDDSIVFSTPNEASISYYRDVSDSNADGLTSQVIREYPLGTRKVLANDVTSLRFLPSGDLVEIRLVVSKTSGGRQYQLTSSAKVEARNEDE